MSKNSKNKFANILITLCIIVGLFATLAVIYEYHRLSTAIPSGVLTAIFGFWGGELLVIALRQIFGSDAIAKAKNNNMGDSI